MALLTLSELRALAAGADWFVHQDGCAWNATGVYMSIGSTLPKRTTIRRPGRAKVGDTLYLYEGLRTKRARKLGEVMCLATTHLMVYQQGWWEHARDDWPVMTLGGALLTDAQAEALARLDTAGLWGWPELAAFFKDSYGLPFEGELICW